MTNTDITRTEVNGCITLERPLDIRDEKGRIVGGFASIKPRLAWALDGSLLPWDGTSYEVRIQATRNGKTYGASAPRTTYPSLQAAEAAAIKGLAEQAKRYARKYAAVVK